MSSDRYTEGYGAGLAETGLKWLQRAEAAEARVRELEARLSNLRYAAQGGNATKGNVEAFKHAADELTRLGSSEKSFISALRQRATMIQDALRALDTGET